jgi:hypothetical protein
MDLPAGAHGPHRPILGHLATHHPIDHLAPLGQRLHRQGREIQPAGAATSERDHDSALGIVDQLPGGARMALLPAGLRPLD